MLLETGVQPSDDVRMSPMERWRWNEDEDEGEDDDMDVDASIDVVAMVWIHVQQVRVQEKSLVRPQRLHRHQGSSPS